MHVAILIPSLRPGGAERAMLNLGRGLAERGIAIDLVLGKAWGPYLHDVPSTIRVVELGTESVLFSLPNLVLYLRHERPDALISALDHQNVSAILAKKLAGVSTRLIVTVHTVVSRSARGLGGLRNRIIPLLARISYPSADVVIAVSQGVAADLRYVIGLRQVNVTIIHNAIVTPEISVLARAPLSDPWFSPDGPPIVLSAGRLAPPKDFQTLIRAFDIVRRHTPARLVILGEGEARGELEDLIGRLELSGLAKLAGFVDNPYAFMARSSVFVLSSRWEGLPSVLIESLACGTPVVATMASSGPAEILADGLYGRLVPVGNQEALARAISETLRTPSDVESLKKRASFFALDRISEQYLAVLRIGQVPKSNNSIASRDGSNR